MGIENGSSLHMIIIAIPNQKSIPALIFSNYYSMKQTDIIIGLMKNNNYASLLQSY